VTFTRTSDLVQRLQIERRELALESTLASQDARPIHSSSPRQPIRDRFPKKS
jgi:hypothetical protein